MDAAVMFDPVRTLTQAPTRALGALFRKRHPPPGSRPGTLEAAEGALPPKIRVITFNAQALDDRDIADVEELASLGDATMSWIDVQGLGDLSVLSRIGQLFELHPLALEDVVNVPQRPKAEEYDKQVLIIARMVRLIERDLDVEQIGIFIGERYVLTFQERYGDVLDTVRLRLRENKGPIRTAGPDYLGYAILDTLVDAYYPVLEQLADKLEELEERVMTRPTTRVLRNLQRIKRTLILMRRAVWPQREAVNLLVREHYALIKQGTRVYLRDTYDHCVQTADVIESYRDMVSELTNTYLSVVSNRMNEVMKVLTIMASIFIPLTFLAGIYGMNFDHMPELHQQWAYPTLLSLMASVAVGMVLFFRRKGWFGDRDRDRD
jgi:magnesium transporter